MIVLFVFNFIVTGFLLSDALLIAYLNVPYPSSSGLVTLIVLACKTELRLNKMKKVEIYIKFFIRIHMSIILRKSFKNVKDF